jgi:acetyl esterase/lipase
MNLFELPVLPADHRIPYGPDPAQFGDLWLPANASASRLPLVVFFHGGWWKSEYDLGYAGYLCQALKRAGFAVWSVEYRRLGATGGGWPETFQDASAGFEFIATLAKRYPLDLARVITMGHSAGGHLAFWIAGRFHLTEGNLLVRTGLHAAPSGALSLAGAVDLRNAIQLSSTPGFEHVRDRIRTFMGGLPAEQPRRYRDGDPGELRPLPVRQILIQGLNDDQIPPDLPLQWLKVANTDGTAASLTIIPDADHFDVVDPRSAAWPKVLAATRSLLA